MKFAITEINIFPIKSCRGFAPNQAVTTARGFKWDRNWMVVKDDGSFITQRQKPTMSQIVPTVLEESEHGQTIRMRLEAPGMKPLEFESSGSGSKRNVIVWQDTCNAVDEGEAVAAWFSEYLQTASQLVRFSPDFTRRVDPKYKTHENDQVGFADGYPFMMISQQSLDDINSKVENQLLMNRFRPNLVVDGCEPFAEDTWKTVKINNIVFHVVKPCSRCVITCTDQETSKVSPEPLRTLSTYRNQMNKIMFGQNLIAEDTGTIKIGDHLEVLN
ncbi:MAG TPA: MOSC N-terminal beta barrel domain-containing protein [Oculatellaceae cyanobacterium]